MFATVMTLALHILPAPASITPLRCSRGYAEIPRTSSTAIDAGALEELNERWRALGIGSVRLGAHPELRFAIDRTIVPQGYRLTANDDGVTVASSDVAGAFYGVMTLAQLPRRIDGRWSVPCVRVDDRPALGWRVLSDDVSRGPLPTMRYFEERIRTIAAFKMNGYSPYMEHVFASPTDPLPAPYDGITPAQLHELARYAARFHVTLIPEQQTFAHMHNTLRVEQYASAAEFPHGFLLSPASPLAAAYLRRIIGQELQAVGPAPFFHIGSDETATLGEGSTQRYVAEHGGRSAVYAAHVNAMAALVAPARVMLWDDGIENDPSIMAHIPRNAVVVNWHYDARASYQSFIDTIARGGLEQMVAPGADNWNEIFPDAHAALENERTFIREGVHAHVLGLFQTVWHDDGETLYEATWYPVLFSADQAWSARGQSPMQFLAAFPSAFFGVDDTRYARDESALGDLDAQLGGNTDKLFWADPFDPRAAARLANVDLRSVRLSAEAVERDLLAARPPLHANAARVMLLAARRYDALGRRYQIASEVRSYYDDAKTHPADAVRDLFWCKYWFWEQRDTDEALAPLYAQAWRYESREGHLASNLERYHLDAQRAIERADAIDRVTYDVYLRTKTLPDLESVIR
ncbi:MAG TPA: glycoside hydrolase family 20 zincin-like fold domain-containing protein [Candidatus Baltobacteraceae bacterium]|nr:glycoside hydrolase family 20 zincin-like fold domain-containing protein [Candidatus Baltobacteraceae bacterium]